MCRPAKPNRGVRLPLLPLCKIYYFDDNTQGMTTNFASLRDEIEVWISQITWWENRAEFRRAFVTLGGKNTWGIEPLTYVQAAKIRNKKKKSGRDRPRWDRICNAIQTQDAERVVSSQTTASTTDGPDAHWTINIGQTTTDAQTQADLIGRQQAEIDAQKRKIRSLEDKIADMKLVHSIEGTKETLNKEITRLRAEHIRQQEKAQKYYALYEDAQYKLDNAPPPGPNTSELEQEIIDLKVALHKANNIQANKQIDFQDAISGLMSGRVLQPELKDKVKLSEPDKDDLVDFQLTWERVLKSLPGSHVYGMKNHESEICRRHKIVIDDYGQPITSQPLQDFARTLQYMDNAIAHVHQELQSVVRVASMLIKAGNDND